MPTIKANITGAIDYALGTLRKNGTVAYPTETVYGLAVRYDHPEAIEKLYQIKGRDKNKPIAILIGKRTQLSLITPNPGAAALKLANAFWPGPLTLVVPKHPTLPANLSFNDTIGIRMPNHPVALDLLRHGPLAVTSANLSGQPNCTNAKMVNAQIGKQVDLILDDGESDGGVPSTVVNMVGNTIEILREGPISKAQLDWVLSRD